MVSSQRCFRTYDLGRIHRSSCARAEEYYTEMVMVTVIDKSEF